MEASAETTAEVTRGDETWVGAPPPRLMDLDRMAAEAKLRHAIVLPVFDVPAEGGGLVGVLERY